MGRTVASGHLAFSFPVIGILIALLRFAMFESRVTFFSRSNLRGLAALGLFALTALSCQKVSSQARLAPFETQEGDGDGSVWVVDSPQSKGRLFLCGTIHILREQDYPLAPAYEAAYANSDKLVLELPPGSGSSGQAGSRMQELGTYPAGTTLAQHVKPETLKSALKWAASRQIPAENILTYHPWYLSLIITSMEYAALGAKSNMGVDHYFEKRAERDRKPGQGLETIDFQLQLFTQLTEEQQRDLLEQTLHEISSLPQEYDKMISAWKHGQLDVLHDMLFKEAEKYPELMQLFLTSRNLAWIEPLDQMLRKGEKVMVLVGTGHFASKTGLIQLLKDRGYTVRHYSEVKDW